MCVWAFECGCARARVGVCVRARVYVCVRVYILVLNYAYVLNVKKGRANIFRRTYLSRCSLIHRVSCYVSCALPHKVVLAGQSSGQPGYFFYMFW